MSLTKPQRSILAEMVRTGLPLTYRGGPWAVGTRETTAVTMRALMDAGMVALQNSDVAKREEYREPRILTDAGRAEGMKAIGGGS